MKTLLFGLLCATVLLGGCSKYKMLNNQEVLNKYGYDMLIHCFEYVKSEGLEDNNVRNNCFMQVSKGKISEYDVISKITYGYY